MGFVSFTVFPEAITLGFIAIRTLLKASHRCLYQLHCISEAITPGLLQSRPSQSPNTVGCVSLTAYLDAITVGFITIRTR
jgi:hypothetical protein